MVHVAYSIQCPADAFGFFFIYMYTEACMIPIPVKQFINFFKSTVIDNVNILKINVKLKHQFTEHFEKILHKLPFIYTHNLDVNYSHLQSYMAITI